MKNLDTEELIHLAIYAASRDNHDDALGYLKQALEQQPDNSNAMLLIAAEYAEIGLYERAVENFDHAYQLDSGLKVAQLQAALLLIALDQLSQATIRLDPLVELGEQDCFGVFAKGLKHLIVEELADAKVCLQQGCELNAENIPLNDDMRRVIEQITERQTLIQQQNTVEAIESDSSDLLHSTYAH